MQQTISPPLVDGPMMARVISSGGEMVGEN
jgi:hypothetical protein